MPARIHVTLQEIGFQLLLHLLVFLFYAIDRRGPGIETFEVAYFTQYALATLVISYLLLPRYLYRHRYEAFSLGVVLVLTVVIVNEELVLEPIFFADERAQHFPGILFSLSQILPIMIILSAGKFAWDAARGQREVAQLKLLVQESELDFLKSQINPHFLFNNLNNLYSYAIEQSPKTPDIILELSSVLRYMLYECRERYVPLKKEIEQLRNFTQLNELQIEERGNIEFTAPPDVGDHRIAPLILMVFIENAFKYGQTGQAEAINITIAISLTDEGALHFHCANNYLPTDQELESGGGIGLVNVRKRLHLLYPDRHELCIRNDDGRQYTVDLRLDLNATSSL